MCKVCKQKGEIRALIEALLDQGISYRKITKLVYNKFEKYISHESIYRYKKYCSKGLQAPNPFNAFYYSHSSVKTRF